MNLEKIIDSFMSDLEKDKRLYHDKYFLNIPDIIDPTVDKKLWDAVYNILYIYLDMVQDFIFSDDDFELFIIDWITFFDRIKRECDDATKVMLLSIYIHGQYESLLDWCIDNEYFEGASNLKRFNEMI